MMIPPTRAPVLFASHGAPTFAIEPGLLGPRLQALGEQAHNVQAVLVVSPHWQTSDIRVMATPAPDTVHDFGGFPSRLYDLQYPALGHRALAEATQQQLRRAGWAAQLDAFRGLDHGAWVPLMHLFPKADVPVFQVSMPYDLTAQQAVQLGQALAPMREQGVLILASGGMTHNLFEFRQMGNTPAAYVQEFTAWIQTAVRANAVKVLQQYRSEAPHAQRAHPSEEHFLPLLVAIGAQLDGDRVDWIDGGITHGVLSMDACVWGLPSGAGAQAVH